LFHLFLRIGAASGLRRLQSLLEQGAIAEDIAAAMSFLRTAAAELQR